MKWYQLHHTDQLLSPALLFYPDRIKNNIQRMISISGSPDRLRPHIKTYKCREMVRMQKEAGILKFKCATLSEAKMLASCGIHDILIAYPLVAANQSYLLQLMKDHPACTFSVLVDHESQVNTWNQLSPSPPDFFIDVNVGMNRTGTTPEKAADLVKLITALGLKLRGLHIYDGHIHDKEITERTKSTESAFEPIQSLINRLNLTDLEIICGGSITFPVHARHSNRHLSPGTTLLWDQGYSSQFPDLNFEIAATLFTRIVSKPGQDLLCLDLGHKAVASEMTSAPVYFPEIPDAEVMNHSEEHLVIKSSHSHEYQIGDHLFGFPWHICPSVALHDKAAIITDHSVSAFWLIEARSRTYTI